MHKAIRGAGARAGGALTGAAGLRARRPILKVPGGGSAAAKVARPGGGVRTVRYAGRATAGAGLTVKTGASTANTGGGGLGLDLLFASLYLANMADVLEAATGAAKLFLEFSKISIDNFTFKLFYRASTTFLITMSVLASSKQVFGDPISCEVVRNRNQYLCSYHYR